MSGSSDHSGFPTTTWRLVGLAGDDQDDAHRAALQELLTRYRPALFSHLRRKRIRHSEAEDLVQGFIQKNILEKEMLAHADSGRGKFRSLLCTALDNFVTNEIQRRNAAKRSAEFAAPLGDEVGQQPSGESTGDTFDVAWARETLSETMRRMEAECNDSDRMDVWAVFMGRIANPILKNEAVVPYEELVAKYKFRAPSQAHNVLVTAKRMFDRTLRQLVSEYALTQEDVEDEIRDLIDILSRKVRTHGQR